ncbi:Glutamate-rich_WD-repeat protein [Hexamita inflata]|uniref:Glutamate-rich WD-repeat protein n=3 Tax=Hexamita inflata TaxID=28002 RepID=A0AA86P1P4_9EUKA|nr:Glutamate-rich WD-repeat protein [Hexamita inflata]
MQRKYNFNDLSSESSNESENTILEEEAIEGEEIPVEDNIQMLENLVADADENQAENFVPDMSNLANLEPSRRAYCVYEKFSTDWPMLTIDCVNTGAHYEKEPHSFHFLSGTTTTSLEKPSIQLIRIAQIQSEQIDDDDSDAEGSVQDYLPPVLERRLFDVNANVLRVKSHTNFYNNQFQAGNPNAGAAWLENGELIFFNLFKEFKTMGTMMSNELPQTSFLQNEQCYDTPVNNLQGSFKYDKPGYGLDFHSLKNLAVAGNQQNILNAFKLTPSGQVMKDGQNYSRFNNGSIEDVKFAKTGAFLLNGVFAACSTNGHAQICDPKSNQQPEPFKVSHADVNVIDFDYQNEHLIYAGDDIGQVFCFDLRNTSQFMTKIHYNQSAITSLKASPSSGCTIAVADDNGAIVFYQMDEENETDLIKLGLPSQYLFLHCGNEEPREISWCGQAEGYLATTDLNGIQLIKPVNL